MGNTASGSRPGPVGRMPDDLVELEDWELTRLWKHSPLTMQQLVQAARSLSADRSSSNNNGNNNNSLSGLLYHQDEQSEEAELAIRLNDLLPPLAT